MSDKAIRKALMAIEEFRKLDPEIPSQFMSAFLIAALEPGITATSLQEKLGLSIQAASRNIARLGSVVDKRSGGKGFGLVEQREDAQDRRRKEIYLTAKGHRLLTAVVDAIGG